MKARFKIRVGGVFFLTFIALALLAPWLSPYAPDAKNLTQQLTPPSLQHWFGQNHHGEDLLSLVMFGTRVSLVVGLATVLISATLGILLGLVSGYARGWVDQVISRTIDIVLAFPGILLAIALAAVLGPSIINVVIALVAGGWVSFARLTRGQILSLRERPYILAAQALGISRWRIMFRHLLPNLWGPILVQATFAMAAAILAESSLSFLGLGVPPGTPSWGAAMNDGVRYLLMAPHMATFPGLVIMLSVLSLNFLGDGLRDRFHER